MNFCQLNLAKFYTLNIQSVKVLWESSSLPYPPPRPQSSVTANLLSLANGSVYDDFNTFSSGKRSEKRKQIMDEEPQTHRQPDFKKKDKKRTTDMDTSK